MEEKSNIVDMLYVITSGKEKTQPTCKKKTCAVYGEGTVTDEMCLAQFAKFHARDFLLDNAPWSGRPVEVDSDQIKTLIENNQCYTMWEIANILKISISSVENHLYQLGYANHFGVWVPHKFSKTKNLLDHMCTSDSLLKHNENVFFKTNCDG